MPGGTSIFTDAFIDDSHRRTTTTNRPQRRDRSVTFTGSDARIGKFIAPTRSTRGPGIVELAGKRRRRLRGCPRACSQKPRSRYEEVGPEEPVVTVPTRDVVNAARERIHLRAKRVTASRRS